MSQLLKQSLWPVYLALIFVQVLFGINFVTSKIIVGHLDPFIWSNIRFIIAGFFMLLITLVSKRKHPKLNKEFLLPIVPLSLLGMALGQSLFLYGLNKTTSTNTAILTSCIPILTVVIVVFRGQEELTLSKFLGLIISFVGVVLIRDFENFELSSDTLMGDFLVFAGAFCFALYLSFGKGFLMKYDNLWVTTWMFLVSGIVMSVINFSKWLHFTLPELDTAFIGSALFTIIGATLITYFLNNWSLKRAPSGNIALFIYMQPIVAGLIGWKILGEEITTRMLVSGSMIMAGLVISIYLSRIGGQKE